MATKLYARVSTHGQAERFGIERQITDFKNAGYSTEDFELAVDEISGAKKSRPALDRLKAEAKSGELTELVLVSLDRLGRSTVDTINLIEYFRDCGCVVRFLKEGISTDKSDAYSEFFITMLSAFSTLERNLMLERQASAYQSMREQGLKLPGRPAVNPEKLQASVELYLAGGKSYRDVEQITGVSASRICRAVKERRETIG